MKDRYRLIRRSNRYYTVDRNTKTRESLGTDSLQVARRLLVAKNEAAQQTDVNLLIGRTYHGANDPNKCATASAILSGSLSVFTMA